MTRECPTRCFSGGDNHGLLIWPVEHLPLDPALSLGCLRCQTNCLAVFTSGSLITKSDEPGAMTERKGSSDLSYSCNPETQWHWPPCSSGPNGVGSSRLRMTISSWCQAKQKTWDDWLVLTPQSTHGMSKQALSRWALLILDSNAKLLRSQTTLTGRRSQERNAHSELGWDRLKKKSP